MQAVLLVGGEGTRIRQKFPGVPKALIPVAGTALLERQIAWLARGGVSSILLAAGHLAERLADWLKRRSLSGPALSLSVEPEPLGTGGALRHCAPHVREDSFLVLNGDSLLPRLDFAGLLAFHRQGGAAVTIAVTLIEQAGRFGAVEYDAQNAVTAFREKASREAGWVNGGVYVMQREILLSIEPNRKRSLETDVFPRLAAERRVRAFAAPPPLLDMGTPEGLAAMEEYFRNEERGTRNEEH